MLPSAQDRAHRKRDDELRPLPEVFAARTNGSALELRQFSCNRKSEAEPAVRTGAARVGLTKPIEHRREKFLFEQSTKQAFCERRKKRHNVSGTEWLIAQRSAIRFSSWLWLFFINESEVTIVTLYRFKCLFYFEAQSLQDFF